MILRLDPIVPAASLAAPLAMLHRACFPEDPWDPRAMAEIVGMAGFFGRIAWHGEEPAGFTLAQDLGEECEVLSLGVAAERRRVGIGSALLDSACRAAYALGARSCVLEVAVDNIGARAFYAARGFVEIGYRRDYYRHGGQSVDALILRLGLAAVSRST